MSDIKKWSIKQVINGLTYFNQSFTSTQDDYLALKNLLVLPKNGFYDGELKKFSKVRIYDNSTHKSTYFFNLVTLPDISTIDVRSRLIGRIYNRIFVKRVTFIYVYEFYPKNIVHQGHQYEFFVSDYFKDQGYNVVNHYKKGQKDEGIDIIATKGDELLLIQCKNWQKSVITHSDIKEFLGNCYLFLYKNPQYRKFKKVRRLFVSSQSSLDESAKYLLKDSYPFVEFLNLPYKSS